MKKIASVHVYDVMSTIVLQALVREYPDYEQGPSEVVLQASVSVQSVGEADAAEWLKDALVALIETL